MMALFTQDSRSVYVPCTEVHGAEAPLLQECNLKLVCVCVVTWTVIVPSEVHSTPSYILLFKQIFYKLTLLC